MNKNYTTSPSHTHGSDQDQDQNTELPQSRDHHDRTTMTVTTMTVTTHRSVTATTHRSPRTPSERPTAHRDHPPPRPLPSATTMTVNSHGPSSGPSTWTFLIRAIGPANHIQQEDPNTSRHKTRSISARPKSTNAPFGTEARTARDTIG